MHNAQPAQTLQGNNETRTPQVKPDVEARLEPARTIIRRVLAANANGYSDEIFVDGEWWAVQVRRRDTAS